ILAAACVAIGLLAPWVVTTLAPVVDMLGASGALLAASLQPLRQVVVVACAIWLLVGVLAYASRRLLARREVSVSATWACGYARPTPRMQYSSSAFAQPLTELFGMLLRSVLRGAAPAGLFPRPASFASETPDLAHRALFAPVFAAIDRTSAKLRWLQHGNVHL